jgi:hypothetical protein
MRFLALLAAPLPLDYSRREADSTGDDEQACGPLGLPHAARRSVGKDVVRAKARFKLACAGNEKGCDDSTRY